MNPLAKHGLQESGRDGASIRDESAEYSLHSSHLDGATSWALVRRGDGPPPAGTVQLLAGPDPRPRQDGRHQHACVIQAPPLARTMSQPTRSESMTAPTRPPTPSSTFKPCLPRIQPRRQIG